MAPEAHAAGSQNVESSAPLPEVVDEIAESPVPAAADAPRRRGRPRGSKDSYQRIHRPALPVVVDEPG